MPPPDLEKFSYRTAKLSPEELGELSNEKIPTKKVIATRPFLNKEKLKKNKRRRSSRIKPEVVDHNGELFIVDGHHKIKRAIEGGEDLIDARVLKTGNKRVGEKLKRRSHGSISDLPVKE